MDIGRALTFFTEDERWIEKTAIGTGVVLISMVLTTILVGVVGFLILMGYGLRLMRNVRDDVHPVLPEWNEWSEDLVRGFKLAVVSFVWSLPALLISVPLFLGNLMADSGGDATQAIGALLVLCSSCLMALYSIFVGFLAPGYTIAFAEREQIGDGLAIGRIWSWTVANLGQVVVAVIAVWIISTILGILGSLVGLLLCLIGIIVTLPLSILVATYIQFHIYGQLAKLGPVVGDSSSPFEPPASDTGDGGWEPVVS